MKSIILTIFSIFLAGVSLIAQPDKTSFNLDFEENDNPTTLANDWIQWGDYKLNSDDKNVQSGKYSGLIESEVPKGNFGSIAYRIPSNYLGEVITLSGYMKIEDVDEGFAGLLLRLDGKSGGLGFDNMQGEEIKGTHDWKKYSISLPYSDKVEKIFVGGILTGTGKAWFDNFEVLIDGKTIQGMPFAIKPKSKADLDTEFDEGSLVELGEITSEEEYKLYTLCKVWGLVKYYHPEIAKGNHNWDYELFRILPKLKADDFEAQLNKWITNLGPIPGPPAEARSNENTTLKIDNSWITKNTLLSQDTKQLLEKIRTCTKHDEHFYVSGHAGVGNPSFDNERPYKSMEFTDDGMRMLSLFRYWNMVEYFFPYKELMDEDWEGVLKSFIPRMANLESGLDYKLATLELIGKIQDTHANIWMRDEELLKFHGELGTPLEIKLIENEWVVTRFFSMFDNPESKIKIGDIITHVDGKAIADLVSQRAKYCPASNVPTQMRDVSRRLLRTNNTSIELGLKNKDGAFTEKVATTLNEAISYWKKDIPSHKMLDGNIGYIYPASLKKEEIHDIMKTFANTKSLIIDLRCYPSDFLVFKLGKYLLPKPTEFVKFTTPIFNEPGRYTITKPLSNGSENPDFYKGKVAILIDETTQSQAEYTTMALRNAPQATVIGSTTSGADGNVSRIILPGGIRTMFSGIGVYYPDGRETQRVGILPDIELRPTIEGIRMGRDELLEMAVKISE